MKKKKKHHTIIYYIIVWALVAFFIVTSTTLIVMQTFWGREKFKTAFISFAKKNNIDLKIESIKGLIPFEYKLKNVKAVLEDQQIDIKSLDCRIKFIPLLKNKLSFKSFTADDITIEAKKDKKAPKKEVYWLSFPLTIKFEKLELNNLHFKIDDEIITLDISGKAKCEKDGKKITSDIVIKRKDYKNSYLDLSFKGYKKNRFIYVKAYLDVDTTRVFTPFFKKEDFDISFDLNFETKGSLDSYLGYFQKNGKKYAKIQGNTFGNIFNITTKDKKPLFLLDQEAEFSFDFVTNEDLSINISKAFFRNDILNIYFDALVNRNFILDKSNMIFRIEDLSKIKSMPFFVFGSFYMQTNYDKAKFISNYSFPDLRINDLSFIDFKGNITGKLIKKILTGKINSNTFTLNQLFNISSNFKWEKSFLSLSDCQIKSPSSSLSANLMITPSYALIGEGKAHFVDLRQIQILYPKIIFNGLADINFEFKQKIDQEKAVQNLLVKIALSNYHFKNVFGKTLNISMNIDSPFSNPSMDFDLKSKDIKFHDLHFDLDIISSTKEENWPYKLQASGLLKQPFTINSNGFLKIKKNEFMLNIQDLNGYLFTHNFITPNPIKLDISEDKFLLSDLYLELADSSILANIDFTKKYSKAKINLKHFPLDFLSINPLDLDVSGYATLDLDLSGYNNDINSILNLDLEELNILTLGEQTPLQANGKLKSDIKNNYFNLDGFLDVKETQLFSFKGKIPLDIDLIKLKILPNRNKSVYLNIKYNGNVEEILDFVNIGPQRLEGELNSEITLSNKLKNLDMNGFCSFKNGYYENYYTGTIIKDIEASLNASNEKITLNYLKGKDTQNGSLFTEGLFSISEKKHFPFYFKTEIKDLLCVDSDIFKAVATANIEISGNKLSSTAKGNVLIDKLEMTIPDKLPIIIPDLKPIYIYHPYQKDIKTEKAKPTIYPIHLDLDIEANKTPIAINGQGLTSTWQGFFKIGGTYMNVETRGSLELIKGKFVFSGRQFDLTTGSVSFSGKPNEMPNLNIQAKMNQQGVDIIANMQGPLDSPKIFFRSSPPLPASSIMSLLIFGQQLSDLSESQTVELSATMSQQLDTSTLSKADALSNLGVDRFNIVQPSPTDPFATDQMAVQLGKYITRGIVVSFSQGEEQGSSNVIVEVDLKHGLIFQAESQQQEEQGKFSLKYRYNY